MKLNIFLLRYKLKNFIALASKVAVECSKATQDILYVVCNNVVSVIGQEDNSILISVFCLQLESKELIFKA